MFTLPIDIKHLIERGFSKVFIGILSADFIIMHVDILITFESLHYVTHFQIYRLMNSEMSWNEAKIVFKMNISVVLFYYASMKCSIGKKIFYSFFSINITKSSELRWNSENVICNNIFFCVLLFSRFTHLRQMVFTGDASFFIPNKIKSFHKKNSL